MQSTAMTDAGQDTAVGAHGARIPALGFGTWELTDRYAPCWTPYGSGRWRSPPTRPSPSDEAHCRENFDVFDFELSADRAPPDTGPD